MPELEKEAMVVSRIVLMLATREMVEVKGIGGHDQCREERASKSQQ
jgi:hypothetical protein